MKEQIEKQAIEEMAHIVSNSIMTWANEMPPISNPHFVATNLYNAGYRKQKYGKWGKRTFIIFDSEKVSYNCSECNTTWDTETKFCPNCGARMSGGKNE